MTAFPGAQSVRVRLDPKLPQASYSGRMLLMLSRGADFDPGENGTPIFGIDVLDLKPGASASFDATSLGHPVRSLASIPAGAYRMQAYLHVYSSFERADGQRLLLPMDRGEGQSWRRSPGNLFSKPQEFPWDPASKQVVELQLSEVVAPIPAPVDTEWVKHVRLESKLLSEFWGAPISFGATILLPRDFEKEPGRHYPVVYMQGHFSPGAPRGFGQGGAFDAYWKSDAAPKLLLVTLQHATPYYDDSYGVNSDNMGPWGDAIVQELIPEVESRFRALGTPETRALTGGSTGGWISVAMQVFYPDFFGGSWSFFPDQLDFRNYQVVNLLEDDNAYFIEHEWSRVARPGMRTTDGDVIYTMEQENLYEEVIGRRYRSGGQWAAWNAVFAPVGEDGYPQSLWDPLTGKIDRVTAAWARERYDMRHILERDWSSIGPKLVGKLHVYCGRMDNYYLEGGVYRLEEFLESTSQPYYAGEFQYGARGGHGWSPFEEEELLGVIADHMQQGSNDG